MTCSSSKTPASQTIKSLPLGNSGLASGLGRPQKCFNLCDGPGVENVFLPQPTFSREPHTEAEVVESHGGMGVGVDRAEHSFVAGALPPAPVHVETHRVAIQLDDGAGLRRAVDDHGVVHRIRLALEQEPTGDVA